MSEYQTSENKSSFPKIMGILNVTPDSFSDGGRFFSFENAISHANKLIDDGADIIDIGGESTRPGSIPVSIETEIERVIPVIKEIRKNDKEIKISIDTTKYEVAKLSIDAGADIINDISGLQFDLRLAELTASENKSLIIMHIQNKPQDMQTHPSYTNVVDEVYDFLKVQSDKAKNLGNKDIYIDIGIGFGKTLEHNLELLKNLNIFKKLNCKMVLGISRKSFIGKLLNIEKADERDIYTALLHSLLLNQDIDVIRVHNVKLIKELELLYSAIQ